MTVNPETEICVTCGATEAMSSAFLGLLDPGDEVVVFEPFYEDNVHFRAVGGLRPMSQVVPLRA